MTKTGIGIVFVIVGPVLMVYGLLDILTPWLTIRWQVRSTVRAIGCRRTIGEAFQRGYGAAPDAEPWNDQRVRRLVRWTGLSLLVVGAAVTAAGIAILVTS